MSEREAGENEQEPIVESANQEELQRGFFADMMMNARRPNVESTVVPEDMTMQIESRTTDMQQKSAMLTTRFRGLTAGNGNQRIRRRMRLEAMKLESYDSLNADGRISGAGSRLSILSHNSRLKDAKVFSEKGSLNQLDDSIGLSVSKKYVAPHPTIISVQDDKDSSCIESESNTTKKAFFMEKILSDSLKPVEDEAADKTSEPANLDSTHGDAHRKEDQITGLFRILYESMMFYIHAYLWQDIYPEDATRQEILAIYFGKRRLPSYKASIIQIMSIGVLVVFCNELGSWNNAIAAGGFGSLMIGNFISALLYFCLIQNLAELSSCIPAAGGNFCYARAMLGDFFGYVVGTSEAVNYAVLLFMLMFSFQDIIVSRLNLGDQPNVIESYITAEYAPQLIYLMYLAILLIIFQIVSIRVRWTAAVIGMVICSIIVIGFCIAILPFWKVINLTQGASRPSYLRSEDLRKVFFAEESLSTLSALAYSCFWYIGIEGLPVISQETEECHKNFPKALTYTWLYLTFVAFFISVGASFAPTYIFVGLSPYVMSDSISYIYGQSAKYASFYLTLLMLLASGYGIMMISSRQMTALSRAGYLPQFLSITNREGVAIRAVIFNIFYIILLSAIALYASYLPIPGASSALAFNRSAQSNQLVISAIIVYVLTSITYISLRIQFPDTPRPYKSFFGILGAVFVLAVTLFYLVTQLWKDPEFRSGLVSYIVKYLILGIYYLVRGRWNLMPTEDALIFSILRDYQKRRTLTPLLNTRTAPVVEMQYQKQTRHNELIKTVLEEYDASRRSTYIAAKKGENKTRPITLTTVSPKNKELLAESPSSLSLKEPVDGDSGIKKSSSMSVKKTGHPIAARQSALFDSRGTK